MSPCPRGSAGIEASPELHSAWRAPDVPLVTLVTLGPWAALAHFPGTQHQHHSEIFPLVKSESSENSPSNLLEEFNILSLPVFSSLHIKYSFLRHKNALKPLYP